MQQNQMTTAKVGKKNVLDYENANESAKIQKAQNDILQETDVTNYSVQSAAYKTQLYVLFSIIAVFELGAAIFFYICAFDVPFYGALTLGIAFAVAYHYFCHIALHDASTGVLFNIDKDSKASKKDVTLSIIVAVLLLITAACIVYFVGKPSYETYRRNHYNAPPPPQATQNTAFTSEQMTNKNGKINTAKVAAVAILTENTAKANENSAKRYENTAHESKAEYDKTTAKTADIVGTSAFFIELLLAVFAYGIAAAKRAATIGIAAQAHAQQQNTGAMQHATPPETQPETQPQIWNIHKQPQTAPTSQRRQIGFFPKAQTNDAPPPETPTPEITPTKVKEPETKTRKPYKILNCLQCNNEFERKVTFQKYCCETCRVTKWENKTGKTLQKSKRKKE